MKLRLKKNYARKPIEVYEPYGTADEAYNGDLAKTQYYVKSKNQSNPGYNHKRSNT